MAKARKQPFYSTSFVAHLKVFLRGSMLMLLGFRFSVTVSVVWVGHVNVEITWIIFI